MLLAACATPEPIRGAPLNYVDPESASRRDPAPKPSPLIEADAGNAFDAAAYGIRKTPIYGAPNTVAKEVHFAPDSHEISAEAATTLDVVAELLSSRPDLTIALVGHATEAEQNPERRSEQRAERVRDELLKRGTQA